LQNKGQFDQAVAEHRTAIELAIELDPSSAVAHTSLSLCPYLTSQPRRAPQTAPP
jgi:hypothetical protein